jgi:hypothetical protein
MVIIYMWAEAAALLFGIATFCSDDYYYLAAWAMIPLIQAMLGICGIGSLTILIK